MIELNLIMTRQFLFSEKSRTNLTLEIKWESVNKRGRKSTVLTTNKDMNARLGCSIHLESLVKVSNSFLTTSENYKPIQQSSNNIANASEFENKQTVQLNHCHNQAVSRSRVRIFPMPKLLQVIYTNCNLMT